MPQANLLGASDFFCQGLQTCGLYSGTQDRAQLTGADCVPVGLNRLGIGEEGSNLDASGARQASLCWQAVLWPG